MQMTETMILFGWSTLLTIIGALFMVILSGIKKDIGKLWESHTKITDAHLSLIQHHDNKYVRRDDYILFQTQVLQSLRRIEERMDDKADKPRGGHS